MTKYDLPDLGYKYRVIASLAHYKSSVGKWEIIDIPDDINEEDAIFFVKLFFC
jgi:hypothetical protein